MYAGLACCQASNIELSIFPCLSYSYLIVLTQRGVGDGSQEETRLGPRAHDSLQSWVAQDVTRIAPHLKPFEVANALHRRVLRGELNVGDSTRMIARLLESRLELQPPPGLHVRALQLASQLKQNSAYDAHCLTLAESFGCELWTSDERFYRAASPSIDNVRWIGGFVAPE